MDEVQDIVHRKVLIFYISALLPAQGTNGASFLK